MKKSLLFFLIITSGEVMSRLSLTELQLKVKDAREKIKPGQKWYHYKNPSLLYEIVDIAIQEATEKICVIYKNLYGEEQLIWVRDLDSWLSIVDHEGKKLNRFERAQ